MIFLVACLLTLITGWLVKYKKVTWLLKGYYLMREAKRQQFDVALLLKHTGNLYFTVSAVFLCMAIVYWTTRIPMAWIAYTGDAVIIVYCVIAIPLIMKRSKNGK